MESISDIIKKEVSRAKEYGYQYISLETEVMKTVGEEMAFRTPENAITVRIPNGDVLTYCCPTCNYAIGEKGTHFCPHCGKALLWEVCDEG